MSLSLQCKLANIIATYSCFLSYERGNAYATMSKVIMGSGGFTVA